MPPPTIVREFIGLSSANAPQAGARGQPLQGLYHRSADRKPTVAVIASTVVLLGNSGGSSCLPHTFTRRRIPERRMLHHPDRPEILTAWMDGAVVDEKDTTASDPDLDLFDERSGPSAFRRVPGALPRSADRVQPCDHPLDADELARIRAAVFSDRPLTVIRTWADTRMVDPTNAQTRAEPHLARITCPSRVVNPERDTGVFPSGAGSVVNALAASDKTRLNIDADHYFTTPGTRDKQADWIDGRW